MKYQVKIGGREHWVELVAEGPGWRVAVDGEGAFLDAAEISPGAYSILTDGQSREVAVERHGDRFQVRFDGATYDLTVLDEVRARTQRPERALAAHGPQQLKAPMPGLVVAIKVAVGEAVAAGAPLLVLEAMKMQNELGAPASGRVEKIHVVQGAAVEAGQALITIASQEGAG